MCIMSALGCAGNMKNGLASTSLRKVSPPPLSCTLVEQRFCLVEISGIEAFLTRQGRGNEAEVADAMIKAHAVIMRIRVIRQALPNFP